METDEAGGARDQDRLSDLSALRDTDDLGAGREPARAEIIFPKNEKVPCVVRGAGRVRARSQATCRDTCPRFGKNQSLSRIICEGQPRPIAAQPLPRLLESVCILIGRKRATVTVRKIQSTRRGPGSQAVALGRRLGTQRISPGRTPAGPFRGTREGVIIGCARARLTYRALQKAYRAKRRTMTQRGAFFLVLGWSVLATPAVGQGPQLHSG